MLQRCSNPKNKFFEEYGGRGIRVCDRWSGTGGFENFLADVGERLAGTSIDRIDTNGNYEPGNCQWSNATTQARSCRHTKLTVDSVNEIRGRSEHGENGASIAARFGVTKEAVYSVLSRRTWADAP
jgi:hypothetical protein